MSKPPATSLSQANGEILANGSTESDSLAEFARYLPQLGKMSEQLKQTSSQIEEAVVDVCNSFQGIAARARATVSRASGLIGRDTKWEAGKQSFDDLIKTCSDTLVKIMNVTTEAGDVSRRAIERIEEMDKAAKKISQALAQLDAITSGNRMLAFNARIEAAHAGPAGIGFSVVAVELAAQSAKSRTVTANVGELVLNLRELAESTLQDLRTMNEKDAERVEQCRREVAASLDGLQAAHSEMAEMLNGMTTDGALLANDIGAAVRGMQFQDRISQRIAHVVADLETLSSRLTAYVSGAPPAPAAFDAGFSAYTMKEERDAAGFHEAEAAGGDVELF
jgi:methyl-accepting chemotaxis protein